MTVSDFIHLRVHSAYSLSEGAIPVKALVELCQTHNMPAVAVTDTNNLFGALEFSGTAAKAGVQPIIGIQLAIEYDTGGDAVDQDRVGGDKPLPAAPMVFLAQSDAGYRNILKILSYAYMQNEDVTDPRIPLDILEQNSAHIIALTGGPGGPLGRLILDSQIPAANRFLQTLQSVFADRLYMEIMRHGTEEERRTETAFLNMAYAHAVPLVATNEAFFPDRKMYEAHDALICIEEKSYVSQAVRRRLTPEHYFKTAAEMRRIFEDLPEAIDNTVVIAKRCAYLVESIDPILPPFDCGEGLTEEDELRRTAKDGLDQRLEVHVYKDGMSEAEKEVVAKPYRERLDFELNVIVQMGFPGYFLIVADFIGWSKEQGIPVGPGRGSGAGSVVAWSLSITDLDPLRWGLLFERFLNPERVSMPDFDIDFCQDRRDEVIRYVQQKYGRDHVAQIITFGKLQARAVLRDVGRVLEMPYGQVDKICKLVPSNPANPMTLPQAIESEPQLRQMIDEDPDVRRLTDMGKKLEGLYRHASTHAAGVVIGDRPLDELIPLYRDPRSELPVTGFNMKYVESAGLVKFDFLGLKTLTVLAMAERLVRAKGIEIDLLTIPLDDAKSFEMMGRGETTGVFQLESAGMRDVLKSMKPDSFEDIIAIVALYRPGPMDNIPAYIRRKHGQEEPDYMHPTLEGILTETHGIIIYQEQVMQIAQVLSGYSLGSADLLRRAMGKKIQSEMDEQRQIFVDGAQAKGVDSKQASDIFDQVNKFAGYGFNKSHAAAYALVAYQTAYLKANHPVEFLAASMTLDMGNTDKLNTFRQELDRLGVPLLIPDINKSDVVFCVERQAGADADALGAIRYALAAVKNVGEAAMQGLVDERAENGPFADINDFVARLDSQQVNKRQIENLARVGAFESLVPNRRQVFQSVEAIMRHANLARAERNSNQISLFGGDSEPVPGIELPDVAEWAPMDRLKEEFDALGYYLSAHPLDSFTKSLEKLKVRRIADITAMRQPGVVKLAGTLIGKKERVSAKGNRFAFVQFSDATGSFEVTIFSEVLNAARELLEVGNSLLIDAVAQFEGDEGEAKFLASRFQPLEAAAANAVDGLRVYINSAAPLEPLREVLANERKGRGRVEIIPRQPGYKTITIELKDTYTISPAIYQAVRAIPGILDVQEI
ncbi:MAG: DNA polymerase III subunit alpha [Rhodospirillales bacterium]|nr:DNA polymerase III subunit alpha [Rhodospirillales bacterium]